MTNVFQYDNFAPTRAPPINLPILNLPGSFGFNDLVYQGGALINWASGNWLDIAIAAFALYGAMIAVPRLINMTGRWGKSTKKSVLAFFR